MFEDARVINMLSLGVLTPACSWVRQDCVKRAIARRMPEHLRDRNIEAYSAGVEKGQALLKDTTFHEMEDAIDV